MPTLNPRINVTLSVSLDTLVGRMATFQRVSKSQVLRELLEAAEPALQRAVTLMDAASKASKGVLAGLAHQMDRNVEQAEDAVDIANGRLERLHRDLVSQAEQIQGKRPARVVRGGRLAETPARSAEERTTKGKNPPASNRGVKSATRRHSHPPKAATKVGGSRR